MLTKAEKCPMPGERQLRHLSPADAAAVKDWFETYLIAPFTGKTGRMKLTDNDVQVIRFLASCKIPAVTISDLMDVTTSTIYQILSERTWKYLVYERPDSPCEAEKAFAVRLEAETGNDPSPQSEPQKEVTGI